MKKVSILNEEEIINYIKDFNGVIKDKDELFFWLNALILEFLRRLILISPEKKISEKEIFEEFKRLYPTYTLPSQLDKKFIKTCLFYNKRLLK